MHGSRWSRPLTGAVAAAVAVVPFLVAVPAASAATGVAVTPSFPANVNVGQIGLPGSIQVGNNSTGLESLGIVTITGVNLVPSCATTAATATGDCPIASADPGVFQLSPTASGETGTACAGQTFNVVTIDPATGQVQFQPVGLPLVLSVPGLTNSICRIDFTFNVLKLPTKPAVASPPDSVATAQIGFANGVAIVNGVLGFAAGTSISTVAKSPTTTGVASSANPSMLGQPVTFTATVGPSASGGTVGFFADGSVTPLSGCATVALAPAGGAFQATCSTSTLPVGNHPIVATYSGDTTFATSTGTLAGGQTVNLAPTFSSAATTTFTVGVAGSFTVTADGFPTPTVTENGPLPSGVTWTSATRRLSGTPAQGSAGNYPITFNAAAGLGTAATQSFTLTVNQASMTYPTDGQTNVDTTVAFTWSTIAQAQGYILVVGSTVSGMDLVSSGILPPTQSSFAVPALPAGPVLHGTLLTEVNNTWTSYQAFTFSAAPGQAALTFPVDGQLGIDAARPFTWSTVAGAQGYILAVGTSRFGSNLVNSGVLPPTQSSFTTPALPAGQTLHATVLTKVNGSFTRFQAITFTAGPPMGSFNHPVNGQLNVATPAAFTWTPTAAAQNYLLAVGTTLYGTDLVNSGVLAASQSSFSVPALPRGRLLYATLLTKINGNWVYQVIGFTAA